MAETAAPQRPATPVLDRMQAIEQLDRDSQGCRLIDHSQLLGRFLDWLAEQGIVLAEWANAEYEVPVLRGDLPRDDRGPRPEGVDYSEWLSQPVRWEHRVAQEKTLWQISRGTRRLLEDFYKIDPMALEAERRALLEYVHELNERDREPGGPGA